MSAKRPNNLLPEGAADSQPKKLKTGTNNNQHKRKEPPLAAATGSDHGQCTFQLLGDDAICHILSFLLCLPKPMKVPQMPSLASVYYQKNIHGDDVNHRLGLPVGNPKVSPRSGNCRTKNSASITAWRGRTWRHLERKRQDSRIISRNDSSSPGN